MKTYEVVNYDTGIVLGSPSPTLVRMSLRDEPTGAVLGYRDAGGKWRYVHPQDESMVLAEGYKVRTVYVREA
jgi:hypothetical protein